MEMEVTVTAGRSVRCSTTDAGVGWFPAPSREYTLGEERARGKGAGAHALSHGRSQATRYDRKHIAACGTAVRCCLLAMVPRPARGCLV